MSIFLHRERGRKGRRWGQARASGHALGEAAQLGCVGQVLVFRKPHTPKASFLTTCPQQEGHAGLLLSERHRIPMLPLVPEAKKGEGNHRACGDPSGHTVFMQKSHVSFGGETEPDRVTELRKRHTKEQPKKTWLAVSRGFRQMGKTDSAVDMMFFRSSATLDCSRALVSKTPSAQLSCRAFASVRCGTRD
jgi:hypothetical protein